MPVHFAITMLLLYIATASAARDRDTEFPGLRKRELTSTPTPSVDCQSKPQSDMPFCNTSLSFMDPERAQDL